MPVRDRFATSRRASQICGALVAATGAVAFVGWVVGSDALKATYAGGIVIKTNSAICLVAAGVALMLRAAPSAGPLAVRTATALAWLATLVGAATLVQHLTNWNLGIDELLFREPAGAPATRSPNRMGPPASLCFPMIGIAILLLDRQTARGRTPSHGIAVAVLLIALLPVLGYIFKVPPLYAISRYTGIALHTALAFIFLAVGLLLARPERGITRRMLTDDAGGVILRRLVPVAVLLPILLGWLRVVGQDAGLFELEAGRLLLIFSVVVVFTTAIWLTGVAVQHQAEARAAAEAGQRELQERLLLTLESERNARALAERSNRMKDEFLATLSHELRTPLNAILGWVQILVRANLDPRDRQRGLEAIERNSRLQAQLIEDLLDMSRIESGKVRLDVRDVDLGLVIESAIAGVAPSADAKGVVIERQLAGPMPTVQGDAARLQQVLWNLLTNAIKFTPRGGRVSVALTTTPEHIEIAVRDTGIGISPEFIEHVFDRFRQADPSTTRRFGGLGLGLSIARQLAELHGGSIRASSDGEGQGSTFALRLPVRGGVGIDAPLLHPPPAPGGITQADQVLAGVRVLVVDDHEDACDLVERVLQDRGADVRSANSVDEALGWLERRPFDVMVSDIGMPVRDGYDLIRIVRAQYPQMPAIALTAFARPEDEQRVMAAGFAAFLPKPLQPDRLIQQVASVYRSR